MAGGGTAIMCKSARRHPRVPAGVRDLPRRAKRCCAVFKEHGDYQHKQRNRMKFMIKELGWDGLSRSTSGRWPSAAAKGPCRCSTSIRRPTSRAPTWTRARGAGAEHDRVARGGGAAERPGHHADARAGVPARRRGVHARWRTTNVRPQKQFGYVHGDGHRAARRSDQRADARARRAGERLRRRHRARDRRSEPGVPLGAASAICASCIAGWRRPASGWPKRPRSPT